MAAARSSREPSTRLALRVCSPHTSGMPFPEYHQDSDAANGRDVCGARWSPVAREEVSRPRVCLGALWEPGSNAANVSTGCGYSMPGRCPGGGPGGESAVRSAGGGRGGGPGGVPINRAAGGGAGNGAPGGAVLAARVPSYLLAAALAVGLAVACPVGRAPASATPAKKSPSLRLWRPRLSTSRKWAVGKTRTALRICQALR